MIAQGNTGFKDQRQKEGQGQRDRDRGERKGQGEEEAAAAGAPVVEQAFALWNQAAAREGWPEVQFLTARGAPRCRRAWRVRRTRRLSGGARAAPRAEFLQGRDGAVHRWFSFDWLLQGKIHAPDGGKIPNVIATTMTTKRRRPHRTLAALRSSGRSPKPVAWPSRRAVDAAGDRAVGCRAQARAGDPRRPGPDRRSAMPAFASPSW